MTTAKFIQSDFITQDSATYKAAIDAGISVMSRIAAMYAPHAKDTPNMTILVDAGSFLYNSAVVSNAQQTTATITAPSAHPRIDLVIIDSYTGVISVVTGLEASSPTPPALPSGKTPVAQIALVVGQSSILNSNITDIRISVGGGAPIDPIAATPGLRTLGTGAQQACAGNDGRLLLPISAAGTEMYLARAATARSTNSTSYVKLKETGALIRGGPMTVTYDFANVGGTGYGKIYKNGSAIGTERTTGGTYSENFTFAAGDVIQVYAKTSNGSNATQISNLIVTANDPYCAREASGY